MSEWDIGGYPWKMALFIMLGGIATSIVSSILFLILRKIWDWVWGQP